MTAPGAPRPGPRARLLAPVDAASLVFFRIAFGLLMVVEVARYLLYGWVDALYTGPAVRFPYLGFEWVRPWPGDGMTLHFLALGALGLCIAVGLAYRLCAALFCAGFGYLFLIDQSLYLNHFYLIALVSFLLVFVPAHRSFSLDARLRPRLRAATVPAWALWLLRFQIALPYVFGGIAKLSPHWLSGAPMRLLLLGRFGTGSPRTDALVADEVVVMAFTYGGLLLDLLVVPLLLFRPTRAPAFAAAVLFHLTNAWLFEIGIFPWFMIAATTLFLAPDWPRRLLGRERPTPVEAPQSLGAPPARPRLGALAVTAAGLWIAVHVALPFRHHLYPGDVAWTSEGDRFAWRMMLNVTSSTFTFHVTHPASGESWSVQPAELLETRQQEALASSSDAVLQLAHLLAQRWRERGYEDVEVRVRAHQSLNGGPPALWIDPEVDLAREPRSLAPKPWMRPTGGAPAQPGRARR